LEVKHPIASLFGKILGFFLIAISSPIQIIVLLIGIGRVKKQINENAMVLEKINSQNN